MWPMCPSNLCPPSPLHEHRACEGIDLARAKPMRALSPAGDGRAH